ncbi:bestrophin family protein [Jatrophihabitans sp. YIM 134969]
MIVSAVPRSGSTLRRLLVPVVVMLLWDVLVTLAWYAKIGGLAGITIQYTLFGTAVALFLGFQVNAAYARWWEARTLWGSVVNHSRTLAREALTLLDGTVAGGRADIGPEMVRAQIAYVHVLRTALRQQEPPRELDVYLTEGAYTRVVGATNRQTAVLLETGRLLAEAHRRGMVDHVARAQIEATLALLTDAQGGLERIKNTPLPVQYRFLPSFFARAFCAVLPFAIVPQLQWLTPLGSGLVGVMFLLAVQVGRELADPFVDDVNDVPMTTICRTIEIDLLQSLGATAPPAVQPVGQVLW